MLLLHMLLMLQISRSHQNITSILHTGFNLLPSSRARSRLSHSGYKSVLV
jgi:hypothetical protein